MALALYIDLALYIALYIDICVANEIARDRSGYVLLCYAVSVSACVSVSFKYRGRCLCFLYVPVVYTVVAPWVLVLSCSLSVGLCVHVCISNVWCNCVQHYRLCIRMCICFYALYVLIITCKICICLCTNMDTCLLICRVIGLYCLFVRRVHGIHCTVVRMWN